MPIETTVEEVEFSFAAPPAPNGPLAGWGRAGWVLGKLVLSGLLVTYLVGWIQDFQRIRRLEAGPTPASKVITISKNEAWQRIYSRPARWVTRPATPPTPRTP